MKGLIAAILMAAPTAAAIAQTTPTAPAPAPAKPAAGGTILDKAVNQPGIGWGVYGATQTSKQVTASDVPGGKALRVQVARAGEHPWDDGAGYPTIKPIAAGDTVLVMVYLRAPEAKDGALVSLPSGAGEADAPYTPIADATVQVGPIWKRYFASGVATKAYSAGKARISLQLAGAAQVVDLGPAFLLDLGAHVDPAKLPHN